MQTPVLTFRTGCRNAATPVRTNARHGNEPMTSKAPDSTTFRFSTADWPEQHRLAIWREAVGRAVIPPDTDRRADGAFPAAGTGHALPRLLLGPRGFAHLRPPRAAR